MGLNRVAAFTGTLVIAVVAVIGEGRPTLAACVPPTIEYLAGPVDRGAPFTLRGSAFGDDCYDTGNAPPGVGNLGFPLDGIVVSVVQNDRAIVVAEGSADAQYAFEVTFNVPNGLSPGEAMIVVSSPAAFVLDATDAPLLVTEAPALDDIDGITTFGPDTAVSFPATTPTSGAVGTADRPRQRDDSDSAPAASAAVGLLVVAVLLGTVVLRRRHQR